MGHVRGGVVHREGVGHVTGSKATYFSFKLQKQEKKEGWDHNENQTNVVNSVVYHIRGVNIHSSSFDPTYKSTPITFYWFANSFQCVF